MAAWFGLLMYPSAPTPPRGCCIAARRRPPRRRGRQHLAFLFRSYTPEYFAFDVVDSLRRIILRRARSSRSAVAAGGTMIAFFYGLYEREAVQARRDQHHRFGRERRDRHFIALLTILQGELMPKPAVGNSASSSRWSSSLSSRASRPRREVGPGAGPKTNGREVARAASLRRPSASQTFSVA